jgi:hypothetical protein
VRPLRLKPDSRRAIHVEAKVPTPGEADNRRKPTERAATKPVENRGTFWVREALLGVVEVDGGEL